MTSCRTGAEHIKSLKDGRTVYIDGKLVDDVTVHPAFRNAVLAAAELYDFQAQPENIEQSHHAPPRTRLIADESLIQFASSWSRYFRPARVSE